MGTFLIDTNSDEACQLPGRRLFPRNNMLFHFRDRDFDLKKLHLFMTTWEQGVHGQVRLEKLMHLKKFSNEAMGRKIELWKSACVLLFFNPNSDGAYRLHGRGLFFVRPQGY